MKKYKTKNLKLSLRYMPSRTNTDATVYYGGVAEPRYIKELTIHVTDDLIYDFDKDDFIKTGKLAVEVSGSDRALKEFGKYLINMATFKSIDPDYHDHFDDIINYDGSPTVNLIVRKQMKEKK